MDTELYLFQLVNPIKITCINSQKGSSKPVHKFRSEIGKTIRNQESDHHSRLKFHTQIKIDDTIHYH